MVTQSASVRVNRANQAPQPVGTIPSQTLGAAASATFDVSGYFRDPDGDALTYTVASANTSVSRATIVGASLGYTGGATGNTTITVTARDTGGLTATQLMRVTVVADTVFVRLNELQIDARGRVRLGSADIGTACLSTPSGGRRIGVTLYQVHWSEWQFRVTASAPATARAAARTTWVRIPGTRRTGQICGLPALGSNPREGEYRLVTELSKDRSRNRYRSGVLTISAPKEPDLVFTDLQPKQVNVVPGDTIEATFTLSNRGTGPSSATTVRAYSSDDSRISTSDTELTTGRIDPIPAGGATRINFELIVPSDITSSTTLYAGLCVDPVQREVNRNNNCSEAISIVVTVVGGLPDLAGGGVTPSTQSVAQGDTARAAFNLANIGSGPSPATTVRVYTSDTPNFGVSAAPPTANRHLSLAWSAGQRRLRTYGELGTRPHHAPRDNLLGCVH